MQIGQKATVHTGARSPSVRGLGSSSVVRPAVPVAVPVALLRRFALLSGTGLLLAALAALAL
jgi:hypothetical protein